MNAIRALVEGGLVGSAGGGAGAGGRAKATTGRGEGVGGGGVNLLGLDGERRAQPSIRSDANVLDPNFILSTSTANRIGLNSDEQELQGPHISHAETSTSTSTAGTSLSAADSEHQTTEQSNDSSSSSLPSSRASSPVSGFGYWTSSSSGRSFDSSFDGRSETSLDGPPPHVPPPGGQANINGLVLSPISNANASHVHNASMASPGLGGNVVDEDLPALAELSGGPSSDTSGAVGGSQQEGDIEHNASNENDFPLPEGNDEEGEVDEDTGTNLPAEDDHTTGNNASDLTLTEPTPFALERASDRHWTDGKRLARGAVIYGIKLVLSKRLHDKGKRGVDACNILVQTKPHGPYHKYARRQNDCGSFPVDVLRAMGHHTLLAAAAESAYRGDVRTHEIPGGANSGDGCVLIVDPRNITEDANGVRIARRAFCVPDTLFNLLVCCSANIVLAPWSGERDLGIFLRMYFCDQYGKISSFDDVVKAASESSEIPFDLARCTNKRLPGIGDGTPEAKMEYLLDLSSKEPKRMFLLQCVCKVDGSTGHYVGLINGTIYDNDAATGGKFEAKDYAEKFLSGVRKAAEIIPRPVSKKKNKNKSRKQRKRELAQQQEKDDGVQRKKARRNG